MEYKIVFNPSLGTAKRVQIEQQIKLDIEKGILKVGTQLPSITDFSKQNGVARDTVEKAYNSLKKSGYIISTAGKGNFVAKETTRLLQVLMVLNKLSSYKKEVFDALVETLGKKAKVDLQIHYYDLRLFKEIVEDNISQYHYIVVMPHFFNWIVEKDYIDILNTLPSSQLIVLDRKVKLNQEIINVFQDFGQDIFSALILEKHHFQKYSGISLIFPKLSHHPLEVIEGVKSFSSQHKKQFDIVDKIDQVKIRKNWAYIALNEDDLAILLKKIRNTTLKLGEDIGVLSFNETILKELLEISVVSTDFAEMGRIAAEMILKKEKGQVKNTFRFIKRQSL